MKNAIILHGTGTLNTEFWFPYMKEKLEQSGYEVWLPQLPNSDFPNLEEWLTLVLTKGKFTSETILIGHSAGSQLILSILEKVSAKIKQAILVSGYAEALRENAISEIKPLLDWQKIKGNVGEIIFINSDNDPWGCDDTQGRIMLDNIGGTLIIPKGEGHMGSSTYNQPYKEFPLLSKLI